jgi:hypothetical protein
MEIELSYGERGAFRDAQIGKCNDRWAYPVKRIAVWDR